MKVIVLSSSPNTDGLTAACARAAAEAARDAGHDVEQVSLNEINLCSCQACNNGWGSCREDRACCQDDDFPALHKRFLAADAYVLVTPVYFGEPSESMKDFMDRLRRCESSVAQRPPGLRGKPLIAVAAAGGSGNGTINCLSDLDRWSDHVGARKWDFIGVTRFTRSYKLEQIAQATRAMLA